MNNRIGMGLAVAAGYVLGRTKKAKLAIGVAGIAAGKKLQLNPQRLVGMAGEQLRKNPQFKELGTQLNQDLRGVGKAATGALVNRQISGLADRLHDRTASVQDQLAGVVPGEDRDAEDRDDDGEEPESKRDEDERPEPEKAARKTSAAAKKPAGTARKAAGTAKKATSAAKPASKKAGGKAPAKKTPAKKQTARKRSASESKGGGRG